MMLRYDPNYSIINRGAHRKPPPLAAVPSVLQHFAFWKAKTIEKDEWHWQIDNLLCHIYNTLYRHDQTYNRHGDPELQLSCANLIDDGERLSLLRHTTRLVHDLVPCDGGQVIDLKRMNEELSRKLLDVFSINTLYKGIYLTIRAEVRAEFWTLTFIADLSKVVRNENRNEIASTIISQIDSLEALMLTASNDYPQTFINNVERPDSNKLENVSHVIYEQFHSFIVDQLLEQASYGLVNPAKNCIADFRGAIIGVAVTCQTTQQPNSLVPESEAMTKPEFQPFRELYANQGKRRSHQARTGYFAFNKSTALVVLDRLWPVITRIFPSKNLANDVFSKPEFTISRLVGSRAIYMTALGRIPETTFIRGSDLRFDPVRYLLVVNYPSRWQIGRVVDRIHRMGVARLAALYNLGELQKINRELSKLTKKWRSQERDEREEPDAIQFSRSLDRINSDIEDGLLYSIERSSYYVNEWRLIAEDVKSERIDGFQTYMDFVRRRMGSSFAFIANLGKQYEDLRTEVDSVLRRQGAQKASETLNSIKSVEDKIERTIAELHIAQRKTNNLLETAELFLLCGVLYYIGSVLWEFTTAVYELTWEKSSAEQADYNHPLIKIIAFATVLSILVIYLLVRRFLADEKKRR